MEDFDINLESEFGKRVLRRLNEERIVWLVTMRSDMTPQPSPVWFWWTGDNIFIFSQPDKPKLRNILENEKVALHFDGDGQGGDIVILNGKAEIAEDILPANEVPAYIRKYREGLKRINMTPEIFAKSYSIPIRVKLYNLRGH
jgi:PPOX class probable F420-dependent enzyme